MKTDTPETNANAGHICYVGEFASPTNIGEFVRSDFARKLERERDEARQATRERQWMPIETAPKDTPILASDQFGVTSVVYWRDVSSSHLPRYAWSSHYDNEYMHHVEAFPTYWMPLPNPPTSERI